MSEGGPKLYTNKPKKAQLKQQPQRASSPSPSPSSSSSSMGTQPPLKTPPPPPPPPPELPKESFARRYKFIWPLLLAVNFAIGAYLFTRTKKKEGGEVPDVPATPISATATAAATASVSENPVTSPIVIEHVKIREPIPEDQQRELFKWLLEEKRKIKPKDPEEKKRIDEEKAIIKQFLRAKCIPPL